MSLYLQNRASDFDDFAQMLERVALSDFASVLCARKFLFDPRGDLPAAERPQHCVLVIIIIIIIIIIIKALRLAAAVFMCFFNLAAAERPQHCALISSKSCIRF